MNNDIRRVRFVTIPLVNSRFQVLVTRRTRILTVFAFSAPLEIGQAQSLTCRVGNQIIIWCVKTGPSLSTADVARTTFALGINSHSTSVVSQTVATGVNIFADDLVLTGPLPDIWCDQNLTLEFQFDLSPTLCTVGLEEYFPISDRRNPPSGG